MWIERLVSKVQRRGLWDSPSAINRAASCEIAQAAFWENPARIIPRVLIQTPLNSVNGLLSFKNSETFKAGLPQTLKMR